MFGNERRQEEQWQDSGANACTGETGREVRISADVTGLASRNNNKGIGLLLLQQSPDKSCVPSSLLHQTSSHIFLSYIFSFLSPFHIHLSDTQILSLSLINGLITTPIIVLCAKALCLIPLPSAALQII